jgi:hypothetical protein
MRALRLSQTGILAPTATPRVVRVLVLGSVLLSACANPPAVSQSPSPESTDVIGTVPPDLAARARHPLAPGEAAVATNWSIRVDSALLHRQFTFGSQRLVPKGIYLAVVLTIRNVSTRNIGLSPLSFEFVYPGPPEERYTPDLDIQARLAAGPRPSGAVALSAFAQIPPGIDLRTAVVFDVRPDPVGGVLRFVELPGDDFLLCSRQNRSRRRYRRYLGIWRWRLVWGQASGSRAARSGSPKTRPACAH